MQLDSGGGEAERTSHLQAARKALFAVSAPEADRNKWPQYQRHKLALHQIPLPLFFFLLFFVVLLLRLVESQGLCDVRDAE